MKQNPVTSVFTLDSPIGPISGGCTSNAVIGIHLGDDSDLCVRETLENLGYAIQEKITPGAEKLKRELEEYFSGKRKRFTVKPHFHGTPFQCEVWNALCKIPCGTMISYGDLAAEVGRPKAARTIGMIMGQNRIPILVPCHRVIASDGGLGGYSGGLEIKKFLLQFEGAKRKNS